ncbi:uncharacterized protein LOC126992020 [Eriocheir sinensis]|uniref:uncharacterized protein LOC126992020 n=1 Tax=Eriocheir sinensis TaxID=95602 RepID=UPI0021C9C5EB|nr:uncharacterized protein LOC126992020 [Eriocheir sinensis]
MSKKCAVKGPTSLKYTLLNIAVPKNQRRLKAGAVPTILLPHQQDDEAQNGATDSCVTSSPHTGQHFETKDDAAQNGATDSCVTSSPHTGQHFETKDGAAPNDATTSFENDSVGENELHLQVQQLLQDRTSLQRIVAEREAKIVVLHKAKMKKEKELNAMEKEIGKLQDSLRCSQDKICIAKKNLSQMFSRSQIDHIFAEKNITNWSEDDINEH